MISTAEQLIASVADARDADDDARARVVAAVSPDLIESLLHAQLVGEHADDVVEFASGSGVSPGVATGQVYFTAEAALDGYDRGEEVVLLCAETTPADEVGMRVAAAIVTSRGGVASHAAVVARGLGLPAVCGVDGLVVTETTATCGEYHLEPGDHITVDGAAGTVTVGASELHHDGPPPELFELLRWADRLATVAVRANADTAADVALALEYGAVGVGLCRTEHMFLGERLPIIQRALLATDPAEEAEALHALTEQQRADFAEVLGALNQQPITIRLLDAPLHEFLADRDEHPEHNPMLGLRGVRLSLLRPEILRAQLTALVEAMGDAAAEGHNPEVEVLVPLVIGEAEFARARQEVLAATTNQLIAAGLQRDISGALPVGAMIETPRAALVAGRLAAEGEFLSFGTNDLTQMTFGFSRDDVERQIVPSYRRQGLLDNNPFASIDQDGVGWLIKHAVTAARRRNPAIKIGVCGEQGGDPASVEFLVDVGVDYVSCSPYRVPLARLIAGQKAYADRQTD
ncbi:MAG: hypothetical protein HKN26_09105 [Acidimicrobiales bacterium]|nr:hypothetical protein [Acidimicrobiales bacterium]